MRGTARGAPPCTEDPYATRRPVILRSLCHRDGAFALDLVAWPVPRRRRSAIFGKCLEIDRGGSDVGFADGDAVRNLGQKIEYNAELGRLVYFTTLS